jgi:hypothetical protein
MMYHFNRYGPREPTAYWTQTGDHSTVASRSEWHLRSAQNKGLGADPSLKNIKVKRANLRTSA